MTDCGWDVSHQQIPSIFQRKTTKWRMPILPTDLFSLYLCYRSNTRKAGVRWMTVTSVAKKALLLSFLLLLFLIYYVPVISSPLPFLFQLWLSAGFSINWSNSLSNRKRSFFFFFILMEKLAHRNTLLALCCRQEWMASAGAERGVAIWVSAVIGC